MAKKYEGTDKKVSKMTREGLTEENLRDGSVSDISSKSRDRPIVKSSEFVLERDRSRTESVDDTKAHKQRQKRIQKYEGKFKEHGMAPEGNFISEQKETIHKKKATKRLTDEQAKTGKLTFENAESQMVRGAGMGIGRAATSVVAGTTSAYVHGKLYQESDDNAAVEGAHTGELSAEIATKSLRQSQIRNARAKEKVSHSGYQLDDMPENKLKFGNPESLDPKETAKKARAKEEQRKLRNRFWQKKKYKEAYQAAKAGKKAGTVGGAQTIAGIDNMTVKAKIAVKQLFAKNRPVFIGIGIFMLLFMLIAASLSSCTAVIQGGMSAVGVSTTYASEDEDIYDAENAYCNLEEALNRQINNMESIHPGYDSYVYNVSEIGHNPYHLISFLNAKYGGFKFEDVEAEIRNLFEEQYKLTTEGKTETSTETDPETGEEITVTKRVLYVTLIAKSFDVVARNNLTEDELVIYDTLNLTLGNRDYLWDIRTISSAGGMSYDIPPEALTDARFARMIREAEKYLGYPYVWGGSSPSTSFDCSGFVSWVINHCGNGWSYGRLTADGLRGICTYVSPSQAKPGDLIFFQGTYNTTGASHVGIYVGEGIMIHCGDPISYANVNSSYWQSHFMCYGRLP